MIEEMVSTKRNVKIVHELKNRIRFRLQSCSLLQKEYYTNNISTIQGIRGIRINEKSKSLVIVYDANPETRESILNKLGLKKRKDLSITDINLNNEEKQSIVGLFTSTLSLFFSFVFPPGLRLLFTLFVTSPLLYRGTKELFKKGLTSNVLEALAVFISVARQEYKTANITNFLLVSGKYLEDTMVHKANLLLLDLMKYDITTVWVEHNGEEKEIPFDDLKVSDIVIVNIGDVIPVDGVISQGVALIDQSSVFGESIPVTKEAGERVYSGTLLVEGTLKVYAEKVGKDTTMYTISEYIRSSLTGRSKQEIEASMLVEKLVPINLALAFSSYLYNQNWRNVASVLQADYSCAIKLSIPVSFKSAIYMAGLTGVLIKDSKALENLADVDVFIFDKTGTLTEGTLEVEEIIYFDEQYKKEDILSMAASIEEHHFHPIAKAIVQEARQKTFKHFRHSEVEFIIGHGVNSCIGGKRIFIGSKHYLEDHVNISFDFFTDLVNYHSVGKTLLFLGIEDKPLGIIVMQDRIRKDAFATVQELKCLGVKEIVLITGDEKIKTRSIAESLGIDLYYSQVEPSEKVEIINLFKKEGKKIAFVGDGINDSPALVSVDVGISMGTAADISKFSSDIVLLNNQLSAISRLKELSLYTKKKINRNFYLTVVANSSILAAATTGFIQPYTTSLLHNGITLGTILNSMVVESKIFKGDIT
ncbi:MAG: heavy metal translocating P-type ATPase [Leptospiraceae bacterium]|nr:heavy metal translocating P-type ATPase [Leptospiraceae bacterium]MCP5496559.1 heavy metal translocating P-type ATPase [Leptospiraceae bacterium]